MEQNKKTTVELEDGEAVYSIAEIEELLKQRDNAVSEANKHLTTIRGLYGDVKKIYGIIPLENGKVNQLKLMSSIGNLMKDPTAIDAFTALSKFVEAYEKQQEGKLKVIEPKK